MNKKTLALLGTLIALLLVAFWLMQQPGERSITTSEGEFLFPLDSLNVDKIEIQSPTSVLVLSRHGSQWQVEQPLEDKADHARVGAFIKTIRELRRGTVVSSNPDKQSLFQVDSSGIQVRVYEKGTLSASFVLGKMGAGFSDAYLRKFDSYDVMTVDASVSYDVRRSADEWRDHTLVNIPQGIITEVRFQYGDTTFTLALRDTAWMIGTERAREQAVRTFLTALSSLQCDGFIDTPPLPAPRVAATVSFGGVQLRFAPRKNSDSYAVQTSSGSRWYELRSWRANQVLKRRKDFLSP